MRLFARLSAVVGFLFFASSSKAQSAGRVECARSDEYVYLYSSITTLQVRGTLQCGEVVNITLRYDDYYGVRTAKNEDGFVSRASVVIIKDQAAGGTGQTPAERERTHYDERPREAAPRKVIPAFTLLKDTPVRVKLTKTLSSATAHVGDDVEFEVLEDVQVEGITVLSKGAKLTGAVAEADPKKRFGHNGSLAVAITSLQLEDGEQAPLRAYEEAKGASSGSVALASKDATMLANAEFTVLIDGDVHLKREGFEKSKSENSSSLSPATEPAKPQR
jgi:hypothetical protein